MAWVLAIRERGEYGDSFRGLGEHSFSGGLHSWLLHFQSSDQEEVDPGLGTRDVG